MRSLAATLIFLTAALAGAQSPEPAPAAPSLPLGNASAVGDLLITPTRLVLEGSRRTAEVTLVNIGTRPATYRISLTHLRMRADGAVQELEQPAPEDRAADSLIRYSPRQVTLEPRVAQTVRIQVRKPANLEAGEYRSHLLFRGIPAPEDVDGGIDPAESDGISIRLIPVYGVSIPLIVRHGETAARAELQELQIEPGPDAQTPFVVRGTIRRHGNRSVYGNLRVVLLNGGTERVVGNINGVAVYPPLDSRNVVIPVRPEEGVKLNGGRLKVSYLDAESDDTGGELLAEGFIDLQ